MHILSHCHIILSRFHIFYDVIYSFKPLFSLKLTFKNTRSKTQQDTLKGKRKKYKMGNDDDATTQQRLHTLYTKLCCKLRMCGRRRGENPSEKIVQPQ